MKTTSKRIIFDRPVKGRGFYSPRYSKKVHLFLRIIAGGYIRMAEKINKVDIKGLDHFINAFSAFKDNGSKLIIAFRHPSKQDPTILAYALNKAIPKAAKKAGKALGFIPHSRFLYGKDVLNWAGSAAAWLFPRVGYIPITNGNTDKKGMNLLRNEMKAGKFPIALAPEGQVTYHMFRCSPLASGIASLAQWGMESGGDVIILPVTMGYKYSDNPEVLVIKILSMWKEQTGSKLALPGDEISIYDILLEATHKTLLILEKFYRIPDKSGVEYRKKSVLKERLQSICYKGLAAAEAINILPPDGNILQRIFRTRYEGMHQIYTEKFDPEELHPMDRNIADFRSLEARIYLRHSQIIDILEYIDPDYISPSCHKEKWCEYALNLLDVINRLKGGNIDSRYYPPGTHSIITAGEILKSSDFLSAEGRNKQARENLTNSLFEKLNNMSANMHFNL